MTWTPESAKLAQLKSAATRAANRLLRKGQETTVPAPAAESQPAQPASVMPQGYYDKWRKMPLDAAIENLERLNRERDVAASIVTDRLHQERGTPPARCYVCEKEISLAGPRPGYNFRDDSHRDPLTGFISPAYTCSTLCFEKYIRLRQQERLK